MFHDLRSLTRPPRDERGAAVAELAMVVPLMLTLLLVIFDFGQGFLAFVSMTDAARDGARVAMQDGVVCADGTPALATAVQNGAGPLYDVTFTAVEVSGRCSVTVDYTYAPILPFVTSSFSLPVMGTVGPLWDGTMSETMVSE